MLHGLAMPLSSLLLWCLCLPGLRDVSQTLKSTHFNLDRSRELTDKKLLESMT